jgi:hypothetical protein
VVSAPACHKGGPHSAISGEFLVELQRSGLWRGRPYKRARPSQEKTKNQKKNNNNILIGQRSGLWSSRPYNSTRPSQRNTKNQIKKLNYTYLD